MLLDQTDLLTHTNASFTVRRMLEVMSGVKVDDEKPSSKHVKPGIM